MPNYPRLNFAPHWKMTNDNLVELIDLVPEDKLDWSPPGEWSIRVITTHIILARYHDPIVPGRDGAQISDVVLDCRTKSGLKQHLRSSWDMVEAFLRDQAKLVPSSSRSRAMPPSTSILKSTTATTSRTTGWRTTSTTARR